MPAWLVTFAASKFGKPVMIIVGMLFLLGVVFLLGKCSRHDDQVTAQVEQTNRSGQAVSDAAAAAIDKLEDRTVTDRAVDQAVDQTVKEIGHAESADAVRDAVIAGVCGQPEHRSDPACGVRRAHP